MARVVNAAAWLDAVLDPGSYASWDVEPGDEAVVTGSGTVHGRQVAVIASEFGFLGGSIGVATAHRIIAAFDRARRERLPVLAGLASGGTRMQEGAAAFLTMRTITAAVGAFRATGLAYLVHLRHPATGGVYASWASLAHDLSAEPHALVGLLGPRVVTALTACGGAREIPAGVQTAENLMAHGRLDAVVDAAGFRDRAAVLLCIVDAALEPLTALQPFETATFAGTSWNAVQAAARPGRPALPDLIAACDTFLPRRGGPGELVTGWAQAGDAAFLLVGQDRTRDTSTTVADIVAARHALELAASLRISVVAVADTSGAEVSAAAEEAGLAQEVARTLATGSALPAPSVTLLLGEGTGAAAIALCGSDALLAVEDSWLAPLPLAGAAALLSGDGGGADAAVREQVAERQRIGAASLLHDGLIDGVAGPAGVALSERLDGNRARSLAGRVLALARAAIA
jgi:acetyl-CoA carboxylase carboxyl transferase subunit beta